MIETVDEGEEVETVENRIYPNIQRHKTTRYEPTFQGKQYKDYYGGMLINFGDTLVFTRTEEY